MSIETRIPGQRMSENKAEQGISKQAIEEVFDIEMASDTVDEELAAPRKKGFMERNLNKLRIGAAVLGLTTAVETKAFDDHVQEPDRYSQVQRRVRETENEFNEEMARYKKIKKAEEARDAADQARVEEYKNAAVNRLVKEFPTSKASAKKVFDKLLAPYSDRTVLEQMAVIDQIEKVGRESLAGKKESAKRPEKAEAGGEIKHLNMECPDGVGLNIKYMIKKTGNESRVLYDGEVRMFSLDRFFKKGTNWGSLKAGHQISLARTVAGERGRGLYIMGRILESLKPGSSDFQVVSQQFKHGMEEFGKNGLEIDWNRFPGVSLVKVNNV